MNGSHEPSSPSLARLVASLTIREVDELLGVFKQLSVDDLRVLAAFPSQPHPLIHAVLTCVHCLLLSLLSTQEKPGQQENLEAPPWSLLRLELLTNALQVWEKLGKRLQKLVTNPKKKKKKQTPVFVQSQLRFVYRTLEPFYEKAAEPAADAKAQSTSYPATLEMYARVSFISAQLAAWVLVCLFYASPSISSEATRIQNSCPGNGGGGGVRSPLKQSPILPPLSPPETQEIQVLDQPSAQRSRVPVVKIASCVRVGLKIGGRYYLFQANLSELSKSSASILHTQGSVSPARQEHRQTSSSLVQWAVLRIDTNRKSSDSLMRNGARSNCREDTNSSSDDGFWSSRQRIPASLSQTLCSSEDQLWYRTPRLALLTTLFQFGLHAHIFENPASLHHHLPTTPMIVAEPSPPPVMLKFAVVVASHPKPELHARKRAQKPLSLVLAGVGSAISRQDQSVAALRVEIHAALTDERAAQARSPGFSVSKSAGSSFDDFLFLYRGSLLPRAFEASLSVVALMPFALLCQVVPGSGEDRVESASSPLQVRHCATQLQRLHLEVSVALRNAGPPNHLPHSTGREEPLPLYGYGDSKADVAYYPMQQVVAFDTQTPTTSAVLAEFFVNWRAFVHFQLLQDSTLLLELSVADDQRNNSSSNKKKKRKLFKIEAQKIADFQFERDSLQLQSKETGPVLPSKRFNPEKEYLRPLYALADVQSATTAVLSTPFTIELFQKLFSGTAADSTGDGSSASPKLRFVLGDEDFVIHVTSARVVLPSPRQSEKSSDKTPTHAPPGPQIQIEIERDASCPLNALLLLRNAYVWQIVKLTPSQASHHHHNHQHRETHEEAPAKWLQDVLRFVTHPQFDFFTRTNSNNSSTFSSTTSQSFLTYFRVPISCKRVETQLEADFWSRSVDWTPFLLRTDLRDSVLRKKYDQMCRSHPPSCAVDSVKFSKLLREIGVQPLYLSIGDVAFLFASHTAAGSHYGMDLDGFLIALTKITELLYPESPSKKKKKVKKKHQSTYSHSKSTTTTSQAFDGSPPVNSSKGYTKLARLFYERMLDAPSVTPIWKELVDSWRLQCKWEILERSAKEHGAATRIQALWKRFATRKRHLQVLLRMKCERKAVTKLQSLQRKRVVYQPFHRLRSQVVKVQLRIKARHELRALRREREAFVETMRVRIVKWMKRRLRVLREWKKTNRIWVLRRERIWAKRKRLVCVAVCRLETRSFRVSLYCATDAIATDGNDSAAAMAPVLGGDEISNAEDLTDVETEERWYELEMLEPSTCWWRRVRVPHRLVDQFIREEEERVGCGNTPQRSTLCGSAAGDEDNGELSPGVPLIQGNRTLGLTCGPRGTRARSDSALNAVLRRLYLHANRDRVEYYRNSIQTSLGKLVFNGAVSVRFLKPDTVACDGEFAYGQETKNDSHVIVKMLQQTRNFKVLAYFPSTSALKRWDFTASFAFQVLQFMRVRQMTLLPDGASTGLSDTPTVNGNHEEDRFHTLFELQRSLKPGSSDKRVAIRSLMRYLVAFGLEPPQYENMVEVTAEKQRLRMENEALELETRRAREEKLVVFAQTRVRRALARKCRLRLALATYKKQFDFETRSFTYVHRLMLPGGGELVMRCREKPHSLFDCDVPMPPDEWQQVHEPISTSAAATTTPKRFFNPFRGTFSQFNEEKAARRIQSWFRRKMWTGVSDLGLQQLARALRYHQQTPSKPPDLSAAATDEEVEAMKRYAFHLHIMEHGIRPEDVEALVGLAVLLIYSCRYPTKQTWPRAQSLIAQAQAQVLRNNCPLKGYEALESVEENCFCWKMFLEPKNAHAMGNYAVFLQCIYHEFDKVGNAAASCFQVFGSNLPTPAELLYRRAIDADPSNEFVIENYWRLERERTPKGVYSFAGPGKIARWRAKEVERVGSLWSVMEDSAARIPSAQRFYRNLQTGMCQWQQPTES